MLLRMKKARALIALSLFLAVSLASAQKANTLTPKEKPMAGNFSSTAGRPMAGAARAAAAFLQPVGR